MRVFFLVREKYNIGVCACVRIYGLYGTHDIYVSVLE